MFYIVNWLRASITFILSYLSLISGTKSLSVCINWIKLQKLKAPGSIDLNIKQSKRIRFLYQEKVLAAALG